MESAANEGQPKCAQRLYGLQDALVYTTTKDANPYSFVRAQGSKQLQAGQLRPIFPKIRR